MFADKKNVVKTKLNNGEGKIFNIEGKRYGAFKDGEGLIHVVETTCTHKQCQVNWNPTAETWDCPCHGSRYTIEGDVIKGPAMRSLDKITDESILDHIS